MMKTRIFSIRGRSMAIQPRRIYERIISDFLDLMTHHFFCKNNPMRPVVFLLNLWKKTRRPLMRWSGSLPCLPVRVRTQTGVPMFPIRANKWFVTMATTVPPSGRDRGQRKNANEDGLVPSILQPDESSKGHRKNWARLIQKIYEIDPLTCPKCHGPMAVIAFIEAEDVIEKILKHLGLWELTPRPPPPIPKAQSQHTVHHSTI